MQEINGQERKTGVARICPEHRRKATGRRRVMMNINPSGKAAQKKDPTVFEAGAQVHKEAPVETGAEKF
jgi:hypothetical protein